MWLRAQELCGSRGGRPWLPVLNSPFDLCGRRATLKNRAQELCGSRGGRPGLPVPYGLCGRKATLNLRVADLLTALENLMGIVWFLFR